MAKKSKKKLTPKMALQGMSSVPARKVVKVGRNEPCPCGSGKKYKDCHESQGETFLLQLAREREREQILEEQKDAPWYKRLLTRLSSS